MDTLSQYNTELEACRDIFLRKTADYGTAWRVLRTISVTDQIYIKAWRIRTLQEKKVQMVADDIPGEFKGIVNYAVIGLIQLEMPGEEPEDIPVNKVEELYNHHADVARKLMLEKNHDYGEAWRNMSGEALTDLILMKLLRIRQILENDGKTQISEGIDANYHDIINYALFALILDAEKKTAMV